MFYTSVKADAVLEKLFSLKYVKFFEARSKVDS